jgi:hypothetical protein
LAFPIRTDHQIEAWLGAVLLADLRELVGARVVERIRPEAVAETRLQRRAVMKNSMKTSSVMEPNV